MSVPSDSTIRERSGQTLAGWAMTGLFAAFMLFDTAIKLLRLPVVDDTLTGLGYPAGMGFPIGVVEGIALVIYLIPRTAVLGAVLLTAVCGGAIASHMRVGSPVFTHLLFGVYLGVLAWGGLWFRDPRVRAILPFRT